MINCRDYRAIFPLSPAEIRMFMARVQELPNGCWLWTGTLDKPGYGRVFLRHSLWMAHRIAYELFVGPVPPGLILHHRCRNKSCCNPAHLKPVTPSENIAEGYAACGGSRTKRPKACCINGHEYTDANTIWRSNHGKRLRACRTCYEASAARKNENRRLRRVAAAALLASAGGTPHV